jgi:protein-tyrosine-phosphatase
VDKLTIEFICSKNVTRSPSYEAVAKRYVEEHRLGSEIDVVSSGVHVDRMNAGEFTLPEAVSYLKMAKSLRKALPQYSDVLAEADETYRHIKTASKKKVMSLAHRTSLIVDTYCIQRSSEALLTRKLERVNGQRQTEQEDNGRVLVVVDPVYGKDVREIYGGRVPTVLSATTFGDAQIPKGWKLEDFIAVVDVAVKNTPGIIRHVRKLRI